MKLNGNLVLNTDGSGTLQNIAIDRFSSAPVTALFDGRLYYDTTVKAYFYYDIAIPAWVQFAVGTSTVSSFATSLVGLTPQTATTGAVVLAGTLGAASGGTGATTLTGYVYGNGTSPMTASTSIPASVLSGQVAVSNGGTGDNTLATNGVLYGNGTSPVGVTAAGSQYQVLVAGSSGTPAFGSINLATSTAVGTSILPLANGGTNAALTASAGSVIYSTASAMAESAVGTSGYALTSGGTGAPTWTQLLASVTVTADGTNLQVNGGTTATVSAPGGTFALTLSTSLQNASAIATSGIVVHNSTGNVWSTVSITGTAGDISVTNGDGLAGSPTIDLINAGTPISNSLVNITTDSKGRVTASTAVTASQLEGIIGTYYLPEAGGTMSGTLNMGGNSITNLATPVNSADAVTKAYVDAATEGLNVKSAVLAASTANIAGTYVNGTSGVGATLTTSSALTTLDGFTLAVNDRVLIKNQSTLTQNGIYVVTSVGGTTVFTRAADFDNSVAGEVHAGDFTFISDGSTLAATGWVQTTVGSGTNGATVIGTDNITWSQFSSASSYAAGAGLTLVGTVFAVDYGAGIGQVPSGDVGINLFSQTSGGLMLTTNGTSRDTSYSGSASAFSQLALLTGAGLTQDTTGLYVGPGQITNTMLTNSAFIVDVDASGTTSVALGSTFKIFGTTNRVTTSVPSTEEVQIDISASYVGQTSITTLGTIATGVWQGTDVGVAYGGTGISTAPTNGQLLIGTSTGGYSVAALTAGSGISVTNGSGSITVANTGVLSVDLNDTSTTPIFTTAPLTATTGAVGLTMALNTQSGNTVFAGPSTGPVASIGYFGAGSGYTNGTYSATALTGGTGTGATANITVAGGVVTTVTMASNGTGYSKGDNLTASITGGGTGFFVHVSGVTVSAAQPSFRAIKSGDLPSIYYLYQNGTAATSFTVTHNLGQKYCNVTVVDSTDEVIIPQSITFTDQNNLVVTFTSAIACTVVVMGVA